MEISGLLSRYLCERIHRSLGTGDKRLAQALVVFGSGDRGCGGCGFGCIGSISKKVKCSQVVVAHGL